MNNAVTIAAYVGAALAEIAGCFAFWAWLRLDKSALWLVPGMVSLAIFAWLLTLADVQAAGRAYAAYGGIYVAASVMWLWAVEGVRSGPLGFDRRLRGADRRRHHSLRAAQRLNGILAAVGIHLHFPRPGAGPSFEMGVSPFETGVSRRRWCASSTPSSG